MVTKQKPMPFTKEEVEKIVKADENFQKQVEGKDIKKEIYVPGRIYNIVVK